MDNSAWGSVAVRYEKDGMNPHSGRSAQKITVEKAGTAFVQLVQYFDVPTGAKVEGTIWARSDTPLASGDAGIFFRHSDTPRTIYSQTEILLTPEWKSYTLRGVVSDAGKTVFIVTVHRPGATIWIDDASLHIVP